MKKKCILAVVIVVLAGLTIIKNLPEKPEQTGAQIKTDAEETETDNKNTQAKAYRAIAYVTVPASDTWRWIGTDGPKEDDAVSAVDTDYVTHINFAFGMIDAYQFEPGKEGCPLKDGLTVSQEAYKDPADGNYHYRATVQGWIEEMNALVDGREYLRALVELKQKKPELKVLLSIGGWNSDGFCYMAQTKEGRAEFIESCIRLIDEYKLDGIDLDWEYPTNGGWGEIVYCDHCIEDGCELLKEFRASLESKYPGDHKLLTIASGMMENWVDREAFDALDYINVMCYDSNPGLGAAQAPLEMAAYGLQSQVSEVGDTPEHREKINLGVPFYNEGGPYLVPYYKGWDGYVDASPEIVAEKMKWVKKEGYGGAFYWAYSMDVFEQDVSDNNKSEVKILQRTLYEALNGK